MVERVDWVVEEVDWVERVDWVSDWSGTVNGRKGWVSGRVVSVSGMSNSSN